LVQVIPAGVDFSV